ncbi:MAG: hypothetical protein JXR81_08450 [Candidatus Goldbacteria bacterium]|nr:hypothetical protein [Candidatus Goldiibacteriota bacterium]
MELLLYFELELDLVGAPFKVRQLNLVLNHAPCRFRHNSIIAAAAGTKKIPQ